MLEALAKKYLAKKGYIWGERRKFEVPHSPSS